MGLGYHLAIGYVRVAMAVFYRRVQVVGRENLPLDKPVILAGNRTLFNPVCVCVHAACALC